MATLNQWRLVLNEVPVDLSDPPDAPTFEKTRHASICAEVRYLRPYLFLSESTSVNAIPKTAKIPVRRNYSGSKQPLDRRRFRHS